MGDTGSNLLGYLLAIAAVQGALKTNAVVARLPAAGRARGPILDSGFVVAKRLKYRGPSIEADRWHFHRMANIGFSQRRTLAYLYGWTLIVAGSRWRSARPLQRRPRQLRLLDRGDEPPSFAVAARASTWSTCSRSSQAALPPAPGAGDRRRCARGGHRSRGRAELETAASGSPIRRRGSYAEIDPEDSPN